MITGAIAVKPRTFAVFFKKSFLSITGILNKDTSQAGKKLCVKG
jgi:hypothetical protein